MQARLLTRELSFVADIEMPFFVTPPDVVVWGQRHFTVYHKDPLTYRERFAWYYTEPRFVEPGG